MNVSIYKHQLTIEPAGRSPSGVIITTLPSCSAHKTIPCDTTPQSLAGFKLETKTTFLPISSSGL